MQESELYDSRQRAQRRSDDGAAALLSTPQAGGDELNRRNARTEEAPVDSGLRNTAQEVQGGPHESRAAAARGHASLPPTLLAPPPGSARLPHDETARVVHGISVRAPAANQPAQVGCTCLIAACALVLGPLIIYGPIYYLLKLFNSCPELPMAVLLGAVAFACRHMQKRKKNAQRREARVRHARALRRAGEARLSANGAAARLDTANYLHVAAGVNSTSVPAPAAPRLLVPSPRAPASAAARPAAAVVDGIAVHENPAYSRPPDGMVVDDVDDIDGTVHVGSVRRISSPAWEGSVRTISSPVIEGEVIEL